MNYAELLAAHDAAVEQNAKLARQVEEMKNSGMAMLKHETERTRECLDLREVIADHKRLVRELDVLINGEEGAAKQASLYDIIAQVQREGIANLRKAAYWFNTLVACARALDLPDDEPIPSGVLRLVQNLVAEREARRFPDADADAKRLDFLDDSMFQSAGQAARAENLAAKLRAPSPASQPVAPEATQADDALSRAMTRIEAHGPQDFSKEWAAAVSRGEAHAQQEAAPIPKYETVLLSGDHGRINDNTVREAMQQEIEAYRVRAAAPTTVPDHSEREAANAGDLDALVREYGNAPVTGSNRTRRVIMQEIYELAGEIFGKAPATSAAIAGESDKLKKWIREAIRLFGSAMKEMHWKDLEAHLKSMQDEGYRLLNQAPTTIAAGQEAANAKDAAREEALLRALQRVVDDEPIPSGVLRLVQNMEYRTCCDHPDCTTCAGRGGFYRLASRREDDK